MAWLIESLVIRLNYLVKSAKVIIKTLLKSLVFEIKILTRLSDSFKTTPVA